MHKTAFGSGKNYRKDLEREKEGRKKGWLPEERKRQKITERMEQGF